MLGMMVVQWCVYVRRYLRNCLCMYTFVWEYVCMLVYVPAYISVGVSECIYMWSLHVGMWLSVICYATLCKAETDLYFTISQTVFVVAQSCFILLRLDSDYTITPPSKVETDSRLSISKVVTSLRLNNVHQ